MSSPHLEILVGMIASGKSTYALKRAKEGALVISHDALTEMLHAEYRYEGGLRNVYRQMEQGIAWAALCAGRDVVVDRTHLTRESRERWIKWARTFDSLQTFDGRGHTTPVDAIAFPVDSPLIHAMRRATSDDRGRSPETWLSVAQGHWRDMAKEPLSINEGFRAMKLVDAKGEVYFTEENKDWS